MWHWLNSDWGRKERRNISFCGDSSPCTFTIVPIYLCFGLTSCTLFSLEHNVPQPESCLTGSDAFELRTSCMLGCWRERHRKSSWPGESKNDVSQNITTTYTVFVMNKAIMLFPNQTSLAKRRIIDIVWQGVYRCYESYWYVTIMWWEKKHRTRMTKLQKFTHIFRETCHMNLDIS